MYVVILFIYQLFKLIFIVLFDHDCLILAHSDAKGHQTNMLMGLFHFKY